MYKNIAKRGLFVWVAASFAIATATVVDICFTAYRNVDVKTPALDKAMKCLPV